MGVTNSSLDKKSRKTKIINSLIDLKLDKKTSDVKILIVDDLEVNSKLLQEYLQLIGFIKDNISYCCNGFDAIEKIKIDPTFDIVFMDIRMVQIDGYKTTEEIRKLGYKKYILGVTGMADVESINTGIKSGMNKVFTKPINIKEIIKLLNSINITEINNIDYFDSI